MKHTFANLSHLEIVGFDEHRVIVHVRDDAGNIIDAVPGKEEHWLVLAVKSDGETVRAQVSEEDWARLIVPLLDAERGDQIVEKKCLLFE